MMKRDLKLVLRLIFLCRLIKQAATLNMHGDQGSFSRRGFGVSATRSAVVASQFFGALVSSANTAEAANPITRGEADNVGAQTLRLIRPKPPKVLRPKLEKDFAVLLMRSSYNTLDALDCISMAQFQRDFFIIRQAEYEPYVKGLGPGVVRQGDLTQPEYFDFISFVQYLAISRAIKDAPYVFEEQQPVDVGEGQPQQFVLKLVKRDPSITNNMLATEHSRRVGLTILNHFDEVFGGTALSLPKCSDGAKPDTDQMLASFSQLVKLFLINGYAWDGSAIVSKPASVLGTASGAEFCLTLVSPATLWGSQCLRLQRAELINDYLLKTAKELAARCGFQFVSANVKYDQSKELTYFTLR